MGWSLPTVPHLHSRAHRGTGHVHWCYPHGRTSHDRGLSQGAQDRGRAGTAGLSPGWGLHSSRPSTWGQRHMEQGLAAHPDPFPTLPAQPHLSQCRPVVAPWQSWQTPVSGWHDSACPLQAQGWQRGKPHQPERQRSQRRPARPARHVHCPLVGLQTAPAAPSGWQRHSVGSDRAIKPCRGMTCWSQTPHPRALKAHHGSRWARGQMSQAGSGHRYDP